MRQMDALTSCPFGFRKQQASAGEQWTKCELKSMKEHPSLVHGATNRCNHLARASSTMTPISFTLRLVVLMWRQAAAVPSTSHSETPP